MKNALQSNKLNDNQFSYMAMKIPETKIIIQEYKINEKDASNEVDCYSKQCSQISSRLSCYLLLQNRISMEEC